MAIATVLQSAGTFLGKILNGIAALGWVTVQCLKDITNAIFVHLLSSVSSK